VLAPMVSVVVLIGPYKNGLYEERGESRDEKRAAEDSAEATACVVGITSSLRSDPDGLDKGCRFARHKGRGFDSFYGDGGWRY
jgi:hypothetical protein